jgi:FixJ family two-component response regulator
MSRRKTLQSTFEFKIGVLQYPVGANRNRDIAERLLISEETAKVHIKHILESWAPVTASKW